MRQQCINDAHTMKPSQVDDLVREIAIPYSALRATFTRKYAEITDDLDHDDVVACIDRLITIFQLPKGFCQRVGFSAKQLVDGAAAGMLIRSSYLTGKPLEGTLVFRDSKTTLLRETPRYRLIHMIAHELAHVRLQLDAHPWEQSEFATDVLALLATGNAEGFMRHMYVPAGQYGYIRKELVPLVLKAMHRYADILYV